ncbi:nickel-type superoxide dismutase maturation protease [Candidatus Leptofilum sp.]|uniref:nickel-type superoxide dismutase maturation protease n=1 Tax=Candidatus Leptofilum sp. TaxID=3241576 RepID=UPI003B595C55
MFEPLPTASIFAFVKLLRPRWQLRRVNGRSMHPTLVEGSTVLVDTAVTHRSPPQIGDIVLLQHPYQPSNQMIKRIINTTEDGRFILRGDNPDSLASTDSRSFGPVRAELILGKVTHRF